MQQTYVPQRNDAQDLMKLAAIGAAIYTGGAAAGATGATTGTIAKAAGSAALQGAGAGGAVGGLFSQNQRAIPTSESEGMSRRMGIIQSDPVATINQARAALGGLPDNQFPETRKALDNAYALAQRNQKIGGY